jgi:hypothetical protein
MPTNQPEFLWRGARSGAGYSAGRINVHLNEDGSELSYALQVKLES